jgi:hypothetical protein
MADRVLPSVRLLLPCDTANFDLSDEKWVLKNPWGTVFLPPGAKFPFRVAEMCVYAQFTGGLGTFDLAVELLRLSDEDSKRLVGTGAATRIEFPGGEPLLTRDLAFPLQRIPLREAGLYEFRAVSVGDAGSEVLAGRTAEIRVIDRRARL